MSIFAQEPLFYGLKPEPGTKALNAEDFVARVEALQLQNGWSDQKAAEEAIGWLRGEARRWFQCDISPVYSPAVVEQVQKSFTAFKKLFQEKFFTVRTVQDLSADWTTIKQRNGERARDFCERVTGEIHGFFNMAQNEEHVIPAAVEDLVMSDLRPEITNAEKAARRTALRRLLGECFARVDRSSRWLVGSIVAKKLMAQGVQDATISRLIRKCDCRGQEIQEIVRAVDEAERRAKAEKKEGRAPAKMAQEVVKSETEEEAFTAPIPADRKKKKKKKSKSPTDKPASNGGSSGGNNGSSRCFIACPLP